MTHRNSRLLLPLILLVWATSTSAQQPVKVSRVTVLTTSGKNLHGIYVDVLRQSLRDAGFVDGRNVVLDYRFGDGNLSRIRTLVAEVMRGGVDVIVAFGLSTAREAAKATKTIPIVVSFAGDLVGNGLVKSLARPEGNVTGMTSHTVDLSAKRLQLLKEAVPTVSRVAMVFGVEGNAGVATRRRSRLAAANLGLILQEVPVKAPSDFEAAFAAMARERADALVLVVSRVTGAHRRRLIRLAAKSRLPTMCWRPAMARDGCLMSYGADRSAMVRRSASFVAKILQGAKPAELPVERPAGLGLALNLKTAKELGIQIPQSIRLRANELVE